MNTYRLTLILALTAVAISAGVNMVRAQICITPLGFPGGDYSWTGDWDPYYYKATCPSGQGVLGVSQSTSDPYYSVHAVLCQASSAFGTVPSLFQVVTVSHTADVNYPTRPTGDWASDEFKTECPAGYMVVGVSQDTSALTIHALYCAPTPTSGYGAQNCQIVHIRDNNGGYDSLDWDPYYFKGNFGGAVTGLVGISFGVTYYQPSHLLFCVY